LKGKYLCTFIALKKSRYGAMSLTLILNTGSVLHELIPLAFKLQCSGILILPPVPDFRKRLFILFQGALKSRRIIVLQRDYFSAYFAAELGNKGVIVAM
jgi:hypothetical protein